MAIRDELIIGKDAFVELSYVDSNVQTSLVRVAMVRAQDNYIEPILGTILYKKILADIQANTLTGLYETLVNDYVVKYLVPMIEVGLMPHLNVEQRNKAVGTSSDETITSADDKRVYSLIRTTEKEAQVYKRRLVAWLCDNADSLPEYTEATDTAEEISPDKDSGSTLNISFL